MDYVSKSYIKSKKKNLTPAEVDWIAQNPYRAWQIKEDMEKAFSEADKRFPSATRHNDRNDAFRHCYWSALITRDVGSVRAKAFTDAHETNPGQPTAEKEMDLHNNSEGIQIGLRYPNGSDEEIAKACEKAVIDGRLKVIAP